MSYLRGTRLEEPDLLFDKTDTSARNNIPYRGLRSFGPYDKDHTIMRLLVLTPESVKSSMDRLINALNNGSVRFPGGLKRFFRSRIEVVRTITITSHRIEDYQESANEIIKTYDPKEIDLILCYIPLTNKYITNTPYYFLKAIFSSYGFPSQMVTSMVFSNFEWSLLNLATAIFAKTGGVPWVLADGLNEIDMILGISISNRITAKSRAGKRPRYVGCVNVFDRYGRWRFFEGTATIYNENIKSRMQQLNELFSGCITKYRSTQHRMPRNIVLHYYKRFSRFEIEKIEELLNDLLGEHNLACISINSNHPFRVYNKSVPDGSFQRGSYVEFNESRYLLSTTGETAIAGRRMGTPKLLDIKIIHMTDDFTSKNELVKGIFYLTKLNWGTSMPMVREPITLTFSEALAYLTAVLTEDEWMGIIKTQINPILSRRPWFI